LNIIFHRSEGKAPACQRGNPREAGPGEGALQSSASLLGSPDPSQKELEGSMALVELG